jgi:hypothetical protein
MIVAKDAKAQRAAHQVLVLAALCGVISVELP